MMTPQKLYFCFPYRGVGGVSILFLRLAQKIARSAHYDVSIVDYDDGYMSRNIHNPNVSLITYTDDAGSVKIPDDTILVCQSITPWSFWAGLDISPRAKVIFWNCHPFNLVPTLPFLRAASISRLGVSKFVSGLILPGYFRKMRKFTYLVHSKKSLFYMDGVNYKATKDFLDIEGLDNPIYVPIPSPDFEISERVQAASEWSGQFLFIGRLVDFKYYSLRRFLLDLQVEGEKYAKLYEVVVIGEGPFLHRLKQEFSGSNSIDIRFLGEQSEAAISQLMSSYQGAVVAMGTASLDSSARAIPTLCLDIAYQNLPKGHQYRFSFEATNFSIADVTLPDWKSYDAMTRRSLSDCLDQLESNYPAIRSATLEFCKEYHSLTSVEETFLKKVANGRLRFEHLSDSGLLEIPVAYKALNFCRRLLRNEFPKRHAR